MGRGAEHGHSVMNPPPAGLTAATFNDTAVTLSGIVETVPSAAVTVRPATGISIRRGGARRPPIEGAIVTSDWRSQSANSA